MASAERRAMQEKLAPKDHMTRFIDGIRIFNDTDYGNDFATRDLRLKAIVGDAMHIINAHWWQRGKLRRQLIKETKTEPVIKKDADRILTLGIEVHANEIKKYEAGYADKVADKWKKNIIKDFGLTEMAEEIEADDPKAA